MSQKKNNLKICYHVTTHAQKQEIQIFCGPSIQQDSLYMSTALNTYFMAIYVILDL